MEKCLLAQVGIPLSHIFVTGPLFDRQDVNCQITVKVILVQKIGLNDNKTYLICLKENMLAVHSSSGNSFNFAICRSFPSIPFVRFGVCVRFKVETCYSIIQRLGFCYRLI